MTESDSQSNKPHLPLTMKLVAAVIIVIGLGALLLPALSTARWVGSTDLEVQFVVTDAKTGLPVPNAIISIRAEKGGFCEDREEREFTLQTDAEGRAKHLCKHCMSFGSSGAFEHTFAVHLPWWWFHASAKDYVDNQEECLDQMVYARTVKEGPPFATLLVPIRLEESK